MAMAEFSFPYWFPGLLGYEYCHVTLKKVVDYEYNHITLLKSLVTNIVTSRRW